MRTVPEETFTDLTTNQDLSAFDLPTQPHAEGITLTQASKPGSPVSNLNAKFVGIKR